MLCEIREDDCGNILIDPVNKRRRNALIREFAGKNWSPQRFQYSLVFLAHGGETGNYGGDFGRFARKLKGIYRASVRIPEERIRAWLGLP